MRRWLGEEDGLGPRRCSGLGRLRAGCRGAASLRPSRVYEHLGVITAPGPVSPWPRGEIAVVGMVRERRRWRGKLVVVEVHEITAEERARIRAALAAVTPDPQQLRRLRALAKNAYAPLPERAKAALQRRRAAS